MLIAKVYEFFFSTETRICTKRSLFWLSLGLVFSLIYSLIALEKGFDGLYKVQDDARQHVFWMSRFIDPQLFPHDLIADYFQSIAPLGYKSVYRIAAIFGIDPLIFNKFVPGILGIIMTGYCFAVSLKLLPIPFGAFVATLLFNQNIWMQAGLISGTARAFAYPLFFIFLYYLIERSLWGVCLAILLAAWFYPSLVLIYAGMLFLQLWRIDGYVPRLCGNRQIYLFNSISLAVAFLGLIPYALATSEYAPITTVEQARSLPEFFAGGRADFFYDDDPWEFWFNASRSGIKLSSALVPQLAYGGLLLPLLLKFPHKFTLSQKINPAISCLKDVLIVSFGLFFAAHALIFRLHLPSRYTSRSLKVVVILAASMTLMLILEAVLRWAIDNQSQFKIKPIIALTTVAIFFSALIGYPATRNSFIKTSYQRGRHPQLYQFLQQQPKDILVASLTGQADLIPSFTQRSVLVSREYAVPYHLGYYQPFRQRVMDLIEAQYTMDLQIVKDFIHRYQIDFWLIEQSSFTPEYLEQNRWLKDHQPVTNTAIETLKQSNTSAIALLQNNCSVFQDEQYTVLSSKCILKQHTKI